LKSTLNAIEVEQSAVVVSMTTTTLPFTLRQHPTLFLHLHTGDTIVWRHHMKFKKQESLLNVLLGTGLYVLDNLRERLPDNIDSN
jgi:hypothetical protein